MLSYLKNNNPNVEILIKSCEGFIVRQEKNKKKKDAKEKKDDKKKKDAVRIFASRNDINFSVLKPHKNVKENAPIIYSLLAAFLYNYHYDMWQENCGAILLETICKRGDAQFDNVSAVRKKKKETTSPPTRDAKITGLKSLIKICGLSSPDVAIDIEFKSGDKAPIGTDLDTLVKGPGGVAVYIHNGVNGFTIGFQSHAKRLSSKKKPLFVLPHGGFCQILGQEMYAQNIIDPDFIQNYLHALKNDFEFYMQRMEHVAKKRRIAPLSKSFQRIPDKSVFFGPPEHTVIPTLVLSSGDSNSKRHTVSIQKIKKIGENQTYMFFALDGENAVEPVSHPKSNFIDVFDTFPVVQATSDGEDTFKVCKKEYMELLKFIFSLIMNILMILICCSP